MLDEEHPYALALGAAVIKAWGSLPADVQQLLFEGAVSAAGPEATACRERLAIFLHDRHPRTDR
jgi:hypothetical protein